MRGSRVWGTALRRKASMSRGLVPAHVGHAHVQHVGAFPLLVPGDLHQAVEVLPGQEVPELLGAVGVGPLAHDQGPGLLVQGHALVEAGHASAPGWASGG